jgi:hypothetical protein
MRSIDAQALAYALEIGAAGIAESQAWADSQIAAAETPSAELLFLATERNLAEAVSLLHILGNGASKEAVGKAVYAWLVRGISSGWKPIPSTCR